MGPNIRSITLSGPQLQGVVDKIIPACAGESVSNRIIGAITYAILQTKPSITETQLRDAVLHVSEFIALQLSDLTEAN